MQGFKSNDSWEKSQQVFSIRVFVTVRNYLFPCSHWYSCTLVTSILYEWNLLNLFLKCFTSMNFQVGVARLNFGILENLMLCCFSVNRSSDVEEDWIHVKHHNVTFWDVYHSFWHRRWPVHASLSLYFSLKNDRKRYLTIRCVTCLFCTLTDPYP